MQALSRLFFESPLQLAVLSLGLLLGGYLLWLRMEPPGRRRVMPVTLGVIVLLFLMQRMVVTTREEIRDALAAFVQAVERKDPQDAAMFLSPTFASDDLDREAMTDFIRRALEHVDVYDTRYGRRDITLAGDTATMDLVATATVRVAGLPRRVTGQWRIGWVREPAGWRITALQPMAIDDVGVSSLSALSRMGGF
jgi:hypothetical protein